jgi:hypothetical protein
MYEVEAKGEAFNPQKPELSKHEISLLFSIFFGHFNLPGS